MCGTGRPPGSRSVPPPLLVAGHSSPSRGPSMQSGTPMGQAVVMAITLPLPVRVAAGILGAGIDLLRALPDDIPAIPVTIVGNAMRLSMKVQQEIAALATRGDELLSGVIGAPQESPAWAKFDDDEPATPVTSIRAPGRTRPATGPGSTGTPAPPAPVPAQ